MLFLDEAPEFRQNLLQSLPEPVEGERVTIVRVGKSIHYPASIQLVMASNCCPCGNLGCENRVCICSHYEIQRYWKRLGNALLDRADIRIPVKLVLSWRLYSTVATASMASSGRTPNRRKTTTIELANLQYRKRLHFFYVYFLFFRIHSMAFPITGGSTGFTRYSKRWVTPALSLSSSSS